MSCQPSAGGQQPEVSVIVPCGGGLGWLPELVRALTAQSSPPPFEVVFVDNVLSDVDRGTLERALISLPSARIIDEPVRGIGPARNAGAAAARGAVLAFVDADDVPSPDWVAALSASTGPGQIAAGPLELRRLNEPWLARTRGDERTNDLYLCEGVFPVAPGGNMAITRADFQALGGFDPAVGPLEDFDLSLRAWRQGMSIAHAGPAASVHYRFRQDPASLYRQGYQYGLGRARTYAELHDDGVVSRCSTAGWKSWVLLVLSVPLAPFTARRRSVAAWILGNRFGRIVGSARHRVVYL